MQKISTMQANGKKIFKGRLTIGLDLGDRFSSYCVLDEAGEILLEHRLPTTPEAAMKQTFGRMPRPHGRGNSSLCPSTSRSYSYSGSNRARIARPSSTGRCSKIPPSRDYFHGSL